MSYARRLLQRLTDESTRQLRDRAVDEMQHELRRLLERRLARRRRGESEGGHDDHVRAEPDGGPERQPARDGNTRHDRGQSAVEAPNPRAEGVVDEVAGERFLVVRQRTIKESAHDAIGDLHRRILVLLLLGSRRRRPSAGGGRREAFVDEAHRPGTDSAGDETCDYAAQDRHDSRPLPRTLPVDMAGNQGALSLELRAAMSLTRLWRGRRRVSEGRKLLSSVYRRFTEGFETADLVAVRALLDSIR